MTVLSSRPAPKATRIEFTELYTMIVGLTLFKLPSDVPPLVFGYLTALREWGMIEDFVVSDACGQLKIRVDLAGESYRGLITYN